MNRNARIALTAFALAALLGIAGDLLLRVEPWGLNALVAAFAFALGFHLLVRRLDLPVRGAVGWVWATVPVLAAVLVWRDSPPLIVLAILGVLIALVCTALIAHGRGLPGAGVWDLAAEAVATGLHAAFGIFRLGGETRSGLVEWAPWNTRVGAVIRGAVLAIPPLLIFGALFVAADAAFARVLNDLVTIQLDRIASHVLLAGFFTWLAAGWLYWVVVNDGARVPRSTVLGIRVGTLEVGVALGLVMALFIAFIAVQSTYMFGGEALIQATTGLTYAEYARGGFFELVTVAFLVLPVLLVGLWLVRDESPRNLRIVRLMAVGLQVLILVIMASALYRMRLYQEAYGLTQLRFLTTAFMVWLALIFALLSGTVLRGAPRWFTAGAVSTALAAVILLAAVNPDARVVETNAERARAGAEFDASYMSELSGDAVPPLLAALPTLPEPARCASAHWLVTRWGSDADARWFSGWRVWNYSRANARRLVLEREDALRAMACVPAQVEPGSAVGQ